MAHLAVLYVYFALFNLAFPFVHAARYGIAHQNILQLTCLLFSAVALGILVWLTPFMYRFIGFTFILSEVCRAMGTHLAPSAASDATRCVEDYHKPPQVAILKEAVPQTVIPHDLVELTADFLAIDDFDLSRMSAAECEELKQRAIHR